jgi:hypothetical protein
MNNDNYQIKPSDGGLLDTLDALQPSTRCRKDTLFAAAYPGIIRAMARQVPQKDILAALRQCGLSIHPSRFRSMLEAEAQRHVNGDAITCAACGLPLPVSPDRRTTPVGDATTGTAGLPTMSQAFDAAKGEPV